jgi:hypothetical protein
VLLWARCYEDGIFCDDVKVVQEVDRAKSCNVIGPLLLEKKKKAREREYLSLLSSSSYCTYVFLVVVLLLSCPRTIFNVCDVHCETFRHFKYYLDNTTGHLVLAHRIRIASTRILFIRSLAF